MNAVTTAWVLMTGTPVALGQAVGDSGTDPGVASAVTVQSIWDFVVKGGPMMIPIGLCSLVAFTVFVERWVSLRRRQVVPSDFLPGLTSLLDEGRGNREDALEFCRNDGSPIARVFTAAVNRLGESLEIVEKHVQEAGQRAILSLRKYLRLLSVIASISPLLGLLGTIFGMIDAFQTVAVSGEALGKTELLAKGIYQAMITTAAGLMVAIPVLMAYHWLSAKIDQRIGEMDEMVAAFIDQYARPTPARETAGPKLQAVEANGDSDDAAATA